MSIRVVLIDDVGEYRRLVRIALTSRGGFEIVGEAGDGETAEQVVSATRPDVAVVDLGLPDLSGRAVISRVRAASPESGVVVFTGTQRQDTLGVSPFVDGYVLKGDDLEMLIDVLTHVAVTAADRSPASLSLPRDPRSAAAARRFVREQCRDSGEELVACAELVVTELVTNAVTHATSACDVRLFRAPRRLRIEVLDHGSGSPDVRTAGDADEGGRGLLLVSALSGAWGVEPTSASGKRVWAELVAASVDHPLSAHCR